VIPISSKVVTKAGEENLEQQRRRDKETKDKEAREIFSEWLQEEATRTYTQWAPLHATLQPDEYELDPERNVPLSDLEPFLFRLVMPKSRAGDLHTYMHTYVCVCMYVCMYP
jgi:hypothetical protein